MSSSLRNISPTERPNVTEQTAAAPAARREDASAPASSLCSMLCSENESIFSRVWTAICSCFSSIWRCLTGAETPNTRVEVNPEATPAQRILTEAEQAEAIVSEGRSRFKFKLEFALGSLLQAGLAGEKDTTVKFIILYEREGKVCQVNPGVDGPNMSSRGSNHPIKERCSQWLHNVLPDGPITENTTVKITLFAVREGESPDTLNRQCHSCFVTPKNHESDPTAYLASEVTREQVVMELENVVDQWSGLGVWNRYARGWAPEEEIHLDDQALGLTNGREILLHWLAQ